jgi:predicted metal-dependent hydrolase
MVIVSGMLLIFKSRIIRISMDINSVAVLPWPPLYRLKKHPRAKQIRFKASLRRGLELIVPSHFNLKNIPALLDQNRPWIEEQLRQLQSQLLSREEILPDKLEFAALEASWKIHYLPSKSLLKLSSRPEQELVLMGRVEDKQACKRKLLKWIKDLAKVHLQTLLEQLSQELNLPYRKVSIRDQLTRWGSCSKTKAINLNYKLIFLPKPLVRHTLIHELCHTVHMNHSELFWQLVAKLDLNTEQNRRALRKANAYLPKWLL